MCVLLCFPKNRHRLFEGVLKVSDRNVFLNRSGVVDLPREKWSTNRKFVKHVFLSFFSLFVSCFFTIFSYIFKCFYVTKPLAGAPQAETSRVFNVLLLPSRLRERPRRKNRECSTLFRSNII